MRAKQTGQKRERGKMTVKGVLVIIGMIALGVLITIGVEEIRSRAMKRALLTEVQTLQENNQELQTKNDDITHKIKTLTAQLEAQAQDYEERLEVANQANESLRTEVRILQTKNDELTEKIKALKTEPGAKIREYEGEISQLEEEVKRHETANQNIEGLRAQVRTLQEENEDLHIKNDELTEQIKALKAELRTKIRIVPNR